MTNPTHSVMLVPCNSATLGQPHQILVIEQKLAYVDRWGVRYTKKEGARRGKSFPSWRLDISSLKPLDKGASWH